MSKKDGERGRPRSELWIHFSLNKGPLYTAECNICKIPISVSRKRLEEDGSTSIHLNIGNAKRHLTKKHPEVLKEDQSVDSHMDNRDVELSSTTDNWADLSLD